MNKVQNFMPRFGSPLWGLIVANIIPVFGVIFLKWKVGPIVLLYWSESVIIIFFNVMKMLWAKGEIMPNQNARNNKPAGKADRRTMIEEYSGTYAVFAIGHCVFIVMIFFRINYERVLTTGFCVAFLMLFVDYAILFKKNFIYSSYYKHVSCAQLYNKFMNNVDARLIIMHVTIISTGWVMQAKSFPLYSLLILIALKTGFELSPYLKEHIKNLLSLGKKTNANK